MAKLGRTASHLKCDTLEVNTVGSNPTTTTNFNMKKLWRIWAKALGEKASADNREADRVALIRTLIVLFYVLTNIFIIAGVIRHW